MSAVVLDNSIVLCWCLADEVDPLAHRALRLTIEQGAIAPRLWRYELWNALLVNERRGRLEAADTRAVFLDLAQMRIELDADHEEAKVLDLAREHRLTAYDASYLEVARRRGLPLATLDRRLRDAAVAEGAALFGNAESAGTGSR